MIKFIGALVLLGCLTVSILRGVGIMPGDFVIPLILLSQLLIAGYVYNLLQITSRDILIRYNIYMDSQENKPAPHTWN